MGVRIEQEDDVFDKLQTVKENVTHLWSGCTSEPMVQMILDQAAYFIRKCRDERREKEMTDG